MAVLHYASSGTNHPVSAWSLILVILHAERMSSLLMAAAQSYQAQVSTGIKQTPEQRAVFLDLIRQCVTVLGIAPKEEMLFPDLVQLVNRVQCERDHK